MLSYQLTDDDYFAIEVSKNVARRLLKHPEITSTQIITLGKALEVLEKLPEPTSGIFIEFGICYRNGNEDFNEMRSYTFGLYDDYFEIQSGGSVYDKRIGSDTIPGKSWFFNLDGAYERSLELYNLEDLIIEYLNLGAEISVDEE